MKLNGIDSISSIKIMKKPKQRGGLAAENLKHKNLGKTPKIFIGLSKQYVRNQNHFSEDLLSHIEKIINNNSLEISYQRISNLMKENERISYIKFHGKCISISLWVQGPPSYELYQKNNIDDNIEFDSLDEYLEYDHKELENYDIDFEEKTSLSLLTLTLDFSGENLTYSLHHNGIVISIHAIARLIQRLGYQTQNIEIKRSIDKIIPWSAINSSLLANGLGYMRQVVTPSESGVWFGSICIIPDKNRNMQLVPVYFIKTFLSISLMEDNQIERLKNFNENDKILTKELYEDIDSFVINNIPPKEENSLNGLISILDAKNDFYSKDKLIDRVEKTLKGYNIDYNQVMKGGVVMKDFDKNFDSFRLVERSHV